MGLGRASGDVAAPNCCAQSAPFACSTASQPCLSKPASHIRQGNPMLLCLGCRTHYSHPVILGGLFRKPIQGL
eukprot:UN27678